MTLWLDWEIELGFSKIRGVGTFLFETSSLFSMHVVLIVILPLSLF